MTDQVCTVHTHTAGDGYPWHYRAYAAPAPQGQIIYLHGIQSHGGWYEQSCRHLQQAGFNVFFLDRRGSGLNEQQRGDTPSFRRLLEDVAEFVRPLRSASPSRPTFLMAVSWGGKLAVALQRRWPGLFDGLALLCPGFFPRVRPAFRERLAVLATRCFRPTARFPIPLNDPELFTTNPRWLTFLREDKLALHQATARFLVESARLDLYLRRTPAHVRCPVLLLLAGQDRIIENARTRAFVERFHTSQRQIIEYSEAQHTLEFESEPAPMLDDLSSWFVRLTSS